MKRMILFLLLSVQLSAQEYSVKKGVVMDNLKVNDSLDESFALYLPPAYENKSLWPVIFVFDGKGRGKSAAQLFKGAAEEQGYIIVSSNNMNLQNGLQQNVLVAARLMQHAAQMFPLDTRQIVSAGALEGARAASTIPLIFENILGAIAVGNLFVDFSLIDKKKNFSFIGIVGDEQTSSAKMILTSEALSELKLPSHVYTYDGNEDWPGPDIISSAVGSLTIDAMRRELRPVDMEFINQMYQQDLGRVNQLMSLNQLINADNLLKVMEEKYAGFLTNSEIRNKQDQLKASSNFAQQKKELREIMEKEGRRMEEFGVYLEEDIATANFENLGWWDFQRKRLDSLAQKDDVEAKMAIRLKNSIIESIRYRRNEMSEQRVPTENKLLANILQTIFDPEAFDAYRNIISLSAIDNDYETAYFYLEEMLKHGYRDMEGLYNIEGTLGLRLTPQYNRTIERYLGSSRYHQSKTDQQ